MNYSIDDAIDILSRTPGTLRALLAGLPPRWAAAEEGPGTWTPLEVVGHLVHGELTDWIPRAEIFLSPSAERRLPPFVPEAMRELNAGKSLEVLLGEFEALRRENLRKLAALGIGEEGLTTTAVHPEFGEVTLRQHLATWVAHDLSHVAQAARILAKQYRGEVGPWTKYLSILK